MPYARPGLGGGGGKASVRCLLCTEEPDRRTHSSCLPVWKISDPCPPPFALEAGLRQLFPAR